jgi:hypothetical protein
MPLLLDRHLLLDGSGDVAVSNYTTAITGDLDVRVKCRATDWTPVANRMISTQFAGANYNYLFYLTPGGLLSFAYSTNGVALVTKTSSVALGTTAGLTDNLSDIWVRVVHDVDNGAAGNDVLFYYSTNGTTWTQLGTTQTTAGTVTRFNSAAAHLVGAYVVAGEPWAGRIYSAEIRNGIAGTIVANPDFTDPAWSWDATSGTDRLGNTWTLTGCRIDGWAPVVAEQHLSLNATNAAASNYTTAVTGDLDVRVKCRAADWTPAANVTLASQAGGAGARNWMLILESTATLRFYYSTDGTNWTTKGENVHLHDAVSLVDNVTDIWLRVTHDVDDGAAGSDVDFYYSWDGTTWVKYATAHTAATATRFNAVYAHKVGVNAVADNLWNGRIYKAEIRDGIAGTIVADPDFGNPSRFRPLVNTGTDAAGNTWTLSNGARIAGVPIIPSKLRGL